jgi:hypothetical protein
MRDRRLVTQLFVEALVLSLPPAVLGLALGQYAVEIGNRLMFLDLDVGTANATCTTMSALHIRPSRGPVLPPS